jgi:hypothetical protein
MASKRKMSGEDEWQTTQIGFDHLNRAKRVSMFKQFIAYPIQHHISITKTIGLMV